MKRHHWRVYVRRIERTPDGYYCPSLRTRIRLAKKARRWGVMGLFETPVCRDSWEGER